MPTSVSTTRAAPTRESKAYEDYFLEHPDDTYRVVEIKRPTAVYEGLPVSLLSLLGDAIPPHAHLGRALQNVVQVVRLQNVLLDPISFSFYSVSHVTEANRFGRVKEPMDALAPYIESVPSAYVGGTRSFQNFYHWLVETMPRTMRLHQKAGGTVLLSHGQKLGFHKIHKSFPDLDLALRPIDEAMFILDVVTTTVTTNFMPSPRLSRHALASEDILLFPRAVTQNLHGKVRRVFISRRDANTRVLNDEATLIAELQKRGFDCPVMSELTLREQAELCCNAEIIISTHGAGLANMLFCQRACKVVEIVPLRRWPHKNLVCMYNLSQVAGFDHYLYDCSYPREDVRLLSQNWSIDHDQFLRFIDRLL